MRIACIPARGEGSRVRELRADGNKLLLDVAGRTVLARQLELLRSFDRVLVLTLEKHHRDVAIAAWPDARVLALTEPAREEDGPALSLALAIEWLGTFGRQPGDVVSFLFSDTLFDPGTDLEPLTQPGAVVVAQVPNGSRFVNVEADEEGRVSRWLDHPDSPEPALATVGLYTQTLEEWRRILAGVGDRGDERFVPPSSYSFMARAAWRAVRTGAWLDVGTVASYRETVELIGGGAP